MADIFEQNQYLDQDPNRESKEWDDEIKNINKIEKTEVDPKYWPTLAKLTEEWLGYEFPDIYKSNKSKQTEIIEKDVKEEKLLAEWKRIEWPDLDNANTYA